MNERNYVYSPEYESFVYRAYSEFSQLISFITFVLWNTYSIILHVNWMIIILMDIILSSNIIGLPIKYINYIGSLIIDEKQGTIKIVLFRFDKIIKEFEIQIENTDIKIVDHWFYIRPIYELRIYSNGKYICKQRQTRNWDIETFKEIKKITLDLKKIIQNELVR